MSGSADKLLRRLEQRPGDRCRIGAECDLVLPVNQLGESDRIPLGLAEHRAHEFSDELNGCVVVVVNEELDGAGFGANVVHERLDTQPWAERTKEEHHERWRVSRGRYPASCRRLLVPGKFCFRPSIVLLFLARTLRLIRACPPWSYPPSRPRTSAPRCCCARKSRCSMLGMRPPLPPAIRCLPP